LQRKKPVFVQLATFDKSNAKRLKKGKDKREIVVQEINHAAASTGASDTP
jgi:hypothetical protein